MVNLKIISFIRLLLIALMLNLLVACYQRPPRYLGYETRNYRPYYNPNYYDYDSGYIPPRNLPGQNSNPYYGTPGYRAPYPQPYYNYRAPPPADNDSGYYYNYPPSYDRRYYNYDNNAAR